MLLTNKHLKAGDLVREAADSRDTFSHLASLVGNMSAHCECVRLHYPAPLAGQPQ